MAAGPTDPPTPSRIAPSLGRRLSLAVFLAVWAPAPVSAQHSADSEGADSEGVDSEAADSEGVDSEAADSEGVDSEAADSEGADSDSSARDSAASPVVAEMTLTDLVEHALTHWPTMDVAAHRLEAAEARLDEAIFSPFFQFQVTGGLTLAPEVRGSPIFSPDSQLPLSNPWRPIAQVALNGLVPLYTFGKLSGARDAARAGVRAAEQERPRAEAELTLQIRRAYFALQLALDTLQMLDEGEGRLQRAVDSLEERLEAGDPEVSDLDRWRLSTTLAEIMGRRSEAVRLEASSRASLEILTGLEEFRVLDCPSTPVELPEPDLDETEAAALAARPELAMLEAGLAARRSELDIVEARYFPDLALALSASYSVGRGVTNQTNPFIVDAANYQTLSAGLVLRWSLDIPGNLARAQRVEAQIAEAEALAEQARAGVLLEVRAGWEALADAKRRETAWADGHRDARSWFVASASAYQVGALEPRELVDAVRAYFSARFNHLSAIRDVNESTARLERVVGSPLLPGDRWETDCREP